MLEHLNLLFYLGHAGSQKEVEKLIKKYMFYIQGDPNNEVSQ